MRALAAYVVALGQVLSIACGSLIVHVVMAKDESEHSLLLLSILLGVGQLPMIYVFRKQAVETGKAVGEIAKAAVIPILPWGRRSGDKEGGNG